MRHSVADKHHGANVQSMKVRRLQQQLFLKEMERLADAMCRHYLDARNDVDGVAPTDLRSHVDNIHSRVHTSLKADLGAIEGSRLLAELHGAETVASPSSRTGHEAFGLAGTQPHPTADPRSGARPLDRGESEWTAQESRGVALRLRRLVPVALSSDVTRLRGLDVRPPIVPPDDTPMLVHRFNTDDARQVSLFDMNMDNNTTCLSARRPQLNAVETSIRSKAKASMITPRPPQRQYPREAITQTLNDDTGGNRLAVGSMLPTMPCVLGSITRATAWSPRDSLAITASKSRAEATASAKFAL